MIWCSLVVTEVDEYVVVFYVVAVVVVGVDMLLSAGGKVVDLLLAAAVLCVYSRDLHLQSHTHTNTDTQIHSQTHSKYICTHRNSMKLYLTYILTKFRMR